MTSMNQKQRTMGSTRTNWRALIGVFLIVGLGVGTSLWYSGHVAAQDETISSQETPRVAFTKVAGQDGDGSELNSIGTLTNTDPTFDRPFSCGSLSGRTTRYDAIPFTVGVAGSVTISFEESDGGSISPNGTSGTGPDTFVVLYAGAFNPASPLTNCSTLNDDISSATNRRSRITTSLAAGSYTAVVTTFAATPSNTADDAALPWSYSLAINTPVTLTVTNTNDTGAGSLRAAMTAAGNGAVIGFSALFNTPQTIGLQTALPTISTSITIRGPGPNLLIVRRNVNAADFRIFDIFGATTDNVAISGMTISGGRAAAGNGGAIQSQTNLTLTNLHVTGNQAENGAGAFVYFANLVIADCTFSNNQANAQAGGFQYTGIGGTSMRLLNSSVSGNTSGSFGGGIEYVGENGSSRLEITNSTIANNSAANGGGVDAFAQNAGNATTTIRNTIISGNTPDNLAVGAAGGSVATFQTLGFNLSENYNGVFTPLATDITAQPLLGPLANNGGTPTHALLAGSPALDKGNRSGAPNDQRGLTRPIDLAGIPNAVGGDGSDIGAYEAQTAPVVDNPPTATATALNVFNGGGSSYPFSVTYSDDIAINVSTLNTGDVTVSGPGGFAATPTFTSVNNGTNGTPRIAFYSFTPPGGVWDTSDNGTYTINVAASQVADTGGNFVPAGPVGSFNVTIATPTSTPTNTPTATPTPASGCTTSYTGPAVVVPDNIPAGVNISLPVSSVGTVNDLNFRFDTSGTCDPTLGNTNAAMDHTFIGDLTFQLTPPDGSPTVAFQARRGGQRDNVCASTLDDEGSFPNISTLTDLNGSPQTGNFSPETTGQLSLLDGENANGTWTLNVSDNANIDTGSMRRFSLVFNTGGTCSGTTPTPTNTPTATPTSTPTATPTPSGGFIVTNLNDSGAGSLRQAILDANANANSPAADTINFQAGLTGTITLTSGEMIVTDSVTINGPGASVISVSGGNASRIFQFNVDQTVTMVGLTLTGGNGVGGASFSGGAIRSFANAMISGVVITGNSATVGGGISNAGTMAISNTVIANNSADNGGGLFSQESLTITNSTFTGNTANFQGGALNLQRSNATLINSTISGNTANSATFPAAVFVFTTTGTRTVQIVNSTIANNLTGTPTTVGGLLVSGQGAGVTATATLRNSIIANNGSINLLTTSSGGGTGTITSQGYNLASDNGGGFLTGTGDQINTNPLLGPLANNGGPTQTHALLTGSPAIDKGDNTGSGVTTDQRGVGFARTVDLAGITNAGDGTDIGAFEAQTIPGGGFESDVAPRALNGDGAVTSTDVVQMRRFAAGLDVINTTTNEFQRADTAPRATAGNGFLDTGDVVQARRYAATLDPLTAAGGPTAPNPEPPPSMLDEVYAYFLGREMRIGKAVFEGDAISFEVDMAIVGDEAAVGFTLEYDAAAMANPLISLGDELADDAVLTLNTTEAGRIGVLIDSATALSIAKGSTRVVTLTFDRIGESSETKLAFTDVLAAKSMANSNGDLLAVRWIVSD